MCSSDLVRDPGVRSPRAQVTVSALMEHGWYAKPRNGAQYAEVTVLPAGTVSTTVVSTASCGPAVVTQETYVFVLPGVPTGFVCDCGQ